jgi:hypothetical protein
MESLQPLEIRFSNHFYLLEYREIVAVKIYGKFVAYDGTAFAIVSDASYKWAAALST